MSARRTILRELKVHHESGNGRYTRPGAITGFDQQPSRYQEAVNKLLQERLINGTKDDEGRLAIALNEHRMADVHKELKPWFMRPAVLMAAFAVVVLVVVGVVLQNGS
jgi:hypothetical protein